MSSSTTLSDKEKEQLLTDAAASCALVYSNGKSEPTENKKPSGLRIKY